MKRSLAFVSILVATSMALAQGQASDPYSKSVKALNQAKSLSVSYAVQTIGGYPQKVKIDLAKPNLARIETANELIVSDGKNTTTFDKKAKTFYKTKTSPESLSKMLGSNDLSLWLPFFDSKTAVKPVSIKDKGTLTRKGTEVVSVELLLSRATGSTLTLSIGKSDSLVRGASFVDGKSTLVVDMSSISVSDSVNDKLFAFTAPEGARELSEAERSSNRWYTNLDEALAAAKASNRLVLIDFYTGWCHWCKVLREEVFPKDAFKAMSKYFVFCEIDAEAEPSLASKYGVNAYPTSVFVKSDGTQVHKLVGYKALDGYVEEMNKARQAGGL